MEQMLARLAHLPNVDLLCDPDVMSFYEGFGMQEASGLVLRRRMDTLLAGLDV